MQEQIQPFGGKDNGLDDANITAGQVQVNTSVVEELLDEIDAVLETDVEVFVKGFVQKGGQ